MKWVATNEDCVQPGLDLSHWPFAFPTLILTNTSIHTGSGAVEAKVWRLDVQFKGFGSEQG